MSLDTPQVGAQLVYDETAQTWSLVSTGAELPPDLIHTEIRAHASLTSTLLDGITVQMYSADLTIPQWQNTAWAELKDGHTANALFANGGAPLSPEGIARLEATLEKEAKFLADFAQDVADGKNSVLEARARARQYSQAMEQSYWNEWKADLAVGPQFAHLEILNNSPGDGQTDCHGNCQCVILFTLDGMVWVLNPASHCKDCPGLAAGSPYRSA